MLSSSKRRFSHLAAFQRLSDGETEFKNHHRLSGLAPLCLESDNLAGETFQRSGS